MKEACGTIGEKRNAYRVLVRNLKERDHMEYLRHRGGKQYLSGKHRTGGRGLDAEASRKRQVAGSCERGNEPSGS
jgi:hypothetical protein